MALYGRPIYRGVGCLGFSSLTPLGGGDQRAVLTVRVVRHSDKYTVKTSQINARLGYQRSEASHKVQRLKNDVGGNVVPGGLERVANLAVGGERQR